MAKRIVHQLIDDLDGTEIADGEGETLQFGLGGTSYEIDLTTANAEALRGVLQPYIDAARRVGAKSAPRTRASRTPDAARIRTWAAENGHTVSERGRVPASVVEAYNLASRLNTGAG